MQDGVCSYTCLYLTTVVKYDVINVFFHYYYYKKILFFYIAPSLQKIFFTHNANGCKCFCSCGLVATHHSTFTNLLLLASIDVQFLHSDLKFLTIIYYLHYLMLFHIFIYRWTWFETNQRYSAFVRLGDWAVLCTTVSQCKLVCVLFICTVVVLAVFGYSRGGISDVWPASRSHRDGSV